MGRTLDPHFDLLHEMELFSRTLMTHRYAPQRVIQESFWLLKDTSDLLRLLPKQLKQIFKKISAEEYLWHIKIHSSDEKHNETVRARHIQSLAMVMSAFLLTGALLIYAHQEPLLLGIPVLSWAAAAAAFFLGLTAIFLFFRKRYIGILRCAQDDAEEQKT